MIKHYKNTVNCDKCGVEEECSSNPRATIDGHIIEDYHPPEGWNEILDMDFCGECSKLLKENIKYFISKK